MEAVGKFEFNRKELIGHGSFAVVFRGRHKEKHGLEVAIKCINKKNLAKSQSLLGKEIKILKELKHENIVGLLDFQEISGCVYLVMEYCNGGDLAEYLLTKGSLSEDTIRTFLQQIAAALSALRSKGIIHRDLKPQNILLSYGSGRRGNPNNVCIKLADFGFARYLQGNTMAATLCGSPMYMAPEVIMAQNYNAKADLWSVGTIVYQCLTGKAPFQASSPQELRSFYERNRNLHPNIPRETSSHLRHLLQGLLQRNHRDRMDFDEFFHHSFLEAAPAVRQSSPVPMPSYPSSGSGSSSSGSSNSHFTPPQSEAGQQRPHPLRKATPPLKDSSSSDTEDFVMVPAQFCSETGEQGGLTNQDSGCSLLGAATCVGRTPPPSPSLRASPSPVSNYNQSVPVPVPTQIHNYQRMEHNLQGVSRTTSPMSPCGVGGVLGCGRGGGSPEAGPGLSHRRMSTGGCRPYQPSPHVATIPETPDQWETEGSRTEQQDVYPPQLCQVSPPSDPSAMETTPIPRRRSHRHSPDTLMHMWTPGRRASCPQKLLQPPLGPILGRRRTMPDLQEPCMTPALLHEMSKDSVKRSMSAGRLSDMLLKAVFGAQLERDAYDTLNAERPMDITALPAGERESPVIFTLGSPPHGLTPPPNATRRRCSVGSCSPASPSWNYNRFNKGFDSADGPRCVCVEVLGGVAFEPPELPEETLMEQGHTDMLARLRFTLAFAHYVMEMAAAKEGGNERSEGPDVSFLEQSIVADQISQLSREWSYAEQLVLYMKCAELLSTALHTAMESIKQDKLYPSASIKQVIRKLNELYKECVTSSRSLTARLQLFFSTKQRLMDRINNITAEKIIYSHTVQMVQDAALDEMFHRGEASAQRYHKALLLMEGLSLLITERTDLSNINKCKLCIERRLSSLQPGACV